MKNNVILKNILTQYKYRRELAENKANLQLQTALQNEDYGKLQRDISSLQFLIVENKIKKLDTQNLEEQLTTLKKTESRLLKKLGYNKNSFNPKYDCPLCNDTGYIQNKYCSCVKKEYYNQLFEIWGITSPPTFTFDDSHLDNIKNQTQKKALRSLYDAFLKYCNKFPNVKPRNALFMGGTGVGKTCLISSIYNELTSRGFSVIFITAIQLNQLMLKFHTSPVYERNIYMADLLDCDMLIIDDLGTEQIYKNVTKEYLLHILDTRTELSKPFIIATNLNENELNYIYNERIFSRMANKKTTATVEIIGNDIRLLK